MGRSTLDKGAAVDLCSVVYSDLTWQCHMCRNWVQGAGVCNTCNHKRCGPQNYRGPEQANRFERKDVI